MEKMKSPEQCGVCHGNTEVASKVVFTVGDQANSETCHTKCVA